MTPEAVSRTFVAEAKDLSDAGQFGEAIKVLQQGLQQFPKMVSARVLLGEVYWTSGDVALARVELEQVIKASPDNFAAHRKLALVYRDLGDHPAAIKACETILKANPKDREMGELLDELLGGPQAEKPDAGEKGVSVRAAGRSETQAVADRSEEEAKATRSTGRRAKSKVAAPAPSAPAAEAHAEELESSPASAKASTAQAEETDSETLAELYVGQGLREEGLAVYRRLAAKSPDDLRLQARIEALESPSVKVDTIPSPPKETPAQATRKSHVRRLEGWLEVIRQRRRA